MTLPEVSALKVSSVPDLPPQTTHRKVGPTNLSGSLGTGLSFFCFVAQGCVERVTALTERGPSLWPSLTTLEMLCKGQMFPESQQTACVCLKGKTSSQPPASPHGQFPPGSAGTKPDARPKSIPLPFPMALGRPQFSNPQPGVLGPEEGWPPTNRAQYQLFGPGMHQK